MSAYLQTWTDGALGARERAGGRLGHAASDQYARMRIGVGDTLYVAYLDDRRLHLIGRLPVEAMLDQNGVEAHFGRPVWQADRHAIGQGGDIMQFDLRVPDAIVRALRFEGGTGHRTALDVRPDGSINGQALQSIRRLALESAALLDEMFDDRPLAPNGASQHPPSPEAAEAVELHAMKVVREHYESGGWEVTDVSKQRPYDLVCRRSADERHVEVKGLSGPPLRVGLTANEVEHARTCPRAVLAVVSHPGDTDHERQVLPRRPSAAARRRRRAEASIPQVAIAWLLHQPGVTAPIIGPRTVEHLDDLLSAADPRPSDDQLARLSGVAAHRARIRSVC